MPSEMRENRTTIIDAEDTDVYVQAAYASQITHGDLRMRRKSSHVECRQLCCAEMSRVIISFHAMTGCDNNSGFFGHSKKKLFEKCVPSVEARELLQECGNSVSLSEDTMCSLKTFAMKFIYSNAKSESTRQCRTFKWGKQKQKSISKLPPDIDSLELHCLRANYLSYIQKNYYLRNHPSPIGYGWQLIDGKCRTLRLVTSVIGSS